MFQMLNIFLFIIPLLAAAEDYYQLLGVKKVAKWPDHYSFPKLLFNRWIVPFSPCGIAGKSQSMHLMSATCSATSNAFDANNRETRKCKPGPGESNLQRSLKKFFSFVLSECRQPGDPKGVQEAGSEAAPGQKRRRGWTFDDLSFSFGKRWDLMEFCGFRTRMKSFWK